MIFEEFPRLGRRGHAGSQVPQGTFRPTLSNGLDNLQGFIPIRYYPRVSYCQVSDSSNELVFCSTLSIGAPFLARVDPLRTRTSKP